jgi:oxygen-independent coproporphyrinogen-3 oxidase
VPQPAEYIRRFTNFQSSTFNLQPFPATPAVAETTPIDRAAEIAETMMMGLRLTRQGVSRVIFQTRFGEELAACFAPQIQRLIARGLLEWVGEKGACLRLTERGRLLGNQVFVEFV